MSSFFSHRNGGGFWAPKFFIFIRSVHHYKQNFNLVIPPWEDWHNCVWCNSMFLHGKNNKKIHFKTCFTQSYIFCNNNAYEDITNWWLGFVHAFAPGDSIQEWFGREKESAMTCLSASIFFKFIKPGPSLENYNMVVGQGIKGMIQSI